MSNFFKLEVDDKNLGWNADWEAQVKTSRVSFVARKCILQWSEQKFESFSLLWGSYRFERFKIKIKKYSKEA